MMLNLKLRYLDHLMQRADSLEKTLMLGGIGGRRRRGDRGWDGWMASPTPWTWVWGNSGSWWWTGRPGVLLFMGSQRVGHDWATELNWIEVVFKIISKQTPYHQQITRNCTVAVRSTFTSDLAEIAKDAKARGGKSERRLSKGTGRWLWPLGEAVGEEAGRKNRILLGRLETPPWSCPEGGLARPGTCKAWNLLFQLAPGKGGCTLRTQRWGGSGLKLVGKPSPPPVPKAEAAWLTREPRGGGGQARKEELMAGSMHACSWLQWKAPRKRKSPCVWVNKCYK